MKRLILMRHAHAWEEIAEEDFFRKLSEKGLTQASLAAGFLSRFKIDSALVSPAVRTMSTLEKIMETLPLKYAVENRLYHGSLSFLTQAVETTEDSVGTLAVIGHNPVIYKAALNFIDEGSPYFKILMEKVISPATVIVIDFREARSWAGLRPGSGICAGIFEPSV